YTPDNAFLGVDSLTYYIRCEQDSSAAKVYFLVQRPLSMTYVACQGASAEVGFDAVSGVQYNWYNAETAGSIVSGGSNTPKRTVVKNATPVETWWVEARTTNGIVFPRYRVDLELSDNCGVVAPVGCAVDGSVIFREDFDGYDNGTDPASPVYSNVPLAAGMTTYNFATTDVNNNPVSVYQGGYYGLPKRGMNLWVATYFTDDHTWPGDNTRGRFFMINGANTFDRLYRQSINGLCDGRELYFSFWAKGCHALLKWTIRSSADNSVLAVFNQSALSGGCAAGTPWLHYGFRFTVPAGVDAVDFDVYNYCLELGGNDFAIDDIEVRFCAPPVTLLPAPFRTDTTVRAGTSFTFDGEYIDAGTFGPSLAYRWEYNATGEVNNPLAWTPIAETEGAVTAGIINSSYTLPNVSKTDTGYYRLAVADAAHIDAYNCRAMSDIVRLRVLDGVRPDSATVQAWRRVEIDVLANDELSASLFAPPFSLIDSVRLKPSAGILEQTGTGSSSRLLYTNRTGGSGLTNGIDSFRYEFTFFDPGIGRTVTVDATVYIYILQNRRGFTACPGEDFTVSLTEQPPGVQFEWYAAEAPFAFLGAGRERTLASVGGDSMYLVRPVTPLGAFPPGLLTVSLADPSEMLYMRWTGLVNSEWHCPDNWVEVRSTGSRTYETPVSRAPARCIPVRLSAGVPFYPELSDSAWCAGITVENRAMLGNPHVLHYDSARVEITLGATERDRFVMWSAPLKHMYSGDYHFKQDGAPRWGDTYMNLFQQANPSGGTSGKNRFTATFGNPDFSLDLGKAFNLKVTSTSVNRTAPWLFPQPDNFYTASGDRYPASGNLARDDRHRFITDGQLLSDADSTFRMNVFDENGFDLLQVVNPYLAWLDVKQFLNGNSLTLSGGYLIWSGRIDDDFEAVSVDGNRYVYTHPALSTSPGLIPPLQSFFVQKSSDAALTWLYMSPKWTTTSDGHHPFVLRAAPDDNGVLRIRASQGAKNSYAALRYSPRAVPEYVRSEDVRTLFYDELPLTLYSLTALREPLSINASGSFGEQETALGLRLLHAGETRLEFTGMDSFGHDVYLIDRERNNLEIDLRETPEYVFTAVKPAGAAAVEINDRFVLRMTYTGRGLVGTSGVERPEVVCTGGNGCLYVRSSRTGITDLQVYNTLGMLLYSDRTLSSEFKVPVAGGPQICIVKARLEDHTTVTRKVAVK
ncbi:MAG: hypothetical protein LBK22_09760, partial [Tannerella sp.]|nr:hypothetical protein [Tannerella sp.]